VVPQLGEVVTGEVYNLLVWLGTSAGIFLLGRGVAGPLADVVSQRLGGLTRLLFTLISAAPLGVKAGELTLSSPVYGAAVAAAALLFLAAGFKTVKLMVVGDVLRAVGVVRVGDYIVVDGQTYRVSAMDATHTTLTTPDLRRTYVPNDYFLGRQFVNMSRSGAGVVSLSITVDGRRISLADAKLILLKTGTDLAKGEMAPGRAPEVRVVSVDGDYVTLRLILYVLNPAKAEALSSHILERVYVKLAEAAKEAAVTL
jgi:small-conductance mechanosensitive channel